MLTNCCQSHIGKSSESIFFENCQTFVEFARDKKDSFDQWLSTKKIDCDFDKFHQLILIQYFKECMAHDLLTHFGDKYIKNINEAAVVVDPYTLTHQKNFHVMSNYRRNENHKK